MDGMCKECKHYGLCDKSGYETCNNWTPDWERAVPLEPVRDTERHSMPTIVSSRSVGKRYHQLCLLLEDYKCGIYTTEEVASVIIKSFK